MNFAAILDATITASMFLTAFYIMLGLAGAIVQCWVDNAPKTHETLETEQIIAEVSRALVTRQEPIEAPKTVEECDPWQMPLNITERAIATIKAESLKPEIKLLAAPKLPTLTEINKAKKAELENYCQNWNLELGTVKFMKDQLKALRA